MTGQLQVTLAHSIQSLLLNMFMLRAHCNDEYPRVGTSVNCCRCASHKAAVRKMPGSTQSVCLLHWRPLCGAFIHSRIACFLCCRLIFISSIGEIPSNAICLNVCCSFHVTQHPCIITRVALRHVMPLVHPCQLSLASSDILIPL